MPQLMNEQEIHVFGLQVLVQWLQSKAYDIEFVQPDKNSLPHIFAKCGDQLTVIIAASAMYPQKGQIADRDKAAVLEMAKELNASCACAYLGIANAEGVDKNDKALMGMPIKGARFVTDFSGLEYIQFED